MQTHFTNNPPSSTTVEACQKLVNMANTIFLCQLALKRKESIAKTEYKCGCNRASPYPVVLRPHGSYPRAKEPLAQIKRLAGYRKCLVDL